MRAATLDLTRDDGERAALEPRLDLHIDDAADGIDRHVAEQRRVHQRQVVSQRQALIQRAAELEHDNDDKILGLAEANAIAAREGARMDGIAPDSPEEAAAIVGARSDILRRAIDERIANRKGGQALVLFDQVKDQLAPADRRALETPVQATRLDQAADQWIARQTRTDGSPLQERLDADPDLPSDAKPIVRAKLDARESADESARIAKVRALDDEVREAVRIFSVEPGAYRPGTFARLADAYNAAGDFQKADEARQLALREPFLRAFAHTSPDRQRTLIASLAVQDRPAAEAIRRDQSAAFAQEASRPGAAQNTDLNSRFAVEGTDDGTAPAKLDSSEAPAPLMLGINAVPQTHPRLTERAEEASAISPENGESGSIGNKPVVTAQVFPPTTIFGRVPPILRPAPPPGTIPTPEGMTPYEQLPRGSFGGDRAGKPFLKDDDPYPEGTPCLYCGVPTTKRPGLPNTLEHDHIIPRSRGGDGDPKNRAPSCRTCNREKGWRTPAEWYLWRWEEASAMPGNLTKIRFNLNPEDWHGIPAELLWAEPIGPEGSRVFRLMNSPYYARGVSYLDIVRAEEAPDGMGLDYAGTVEPSGHSTVWLLADPNSAEFAHHLDSLHSMGATHEALIRNPRQTLYSVDVPPEADFDEVLSVLEEGDRGGVWQWQVPHEAIGPSPSGTA